VCELLLTGTALGCVCSAHLELSSSTHVYEDHPVDTSRKKTEELWPLAPSCLSVCHHVATWEPLKRFSLTCTLWCYSFSIISQNTEHCMKTQLLFCTVSELITAFLTVIFSRPVIMSQGLYCGSTYHLYLAAQNKIGSSSPSPTLTVKTQGRAPGVPEAQMLLAPNSTSVLLRLHVWPDNDCPLTHFILQYRPISNPHWTLGMLDF
jgi:hypothetical protein